MASAQAEIIRIELSPPRPNALLCGRYLLERPLGSGGNATVYRAIDKALDAPVAIKLVNTGSSAASQSFRAEAVATMRLGHPRIVRVHTYDCDLPWELLVMELVDGPSLNAWRQRQPDNRLTPAETVRVGIECLEGLEFAHGMGVIHNDVKPGNMLLSPTGIKLCDFGLAARPSPTGRGKTVAGTLLYISPERALGEVGDHRSDLYSLAATLYGLGNGRPLYPEDEAYHGHLHAPPPRSRHLPPAVDEVLQIALSKDPSRRFQSAAQMRAALLAAARSEPARRPTPPPPPDDDDDECSIEIVIDEDSDDWVEIPALELPSTFGGTLSVAPFRIARTPVTNAQYYLYVDATGAEPPFHWRRGLPPDPDHPVVGVTLDDARRYAAWRGARLPTSLEWEAAARGARAAAWPWGDTWDPSRCQCAEIGATGTAPVDRFPEGASPDGCLDLVGNVWEWTEPVPGVEPGCAWVMGGSFRHRFAPRAGIPRTLVRVDKAYSYLGFRCAERR